MEIEVKKSLRRVLSGTAESKDRLTRELRRRASNNPETKEIISVISKTKGLVVRRKGFLKKLKPSVKNLVEEEDTPEEIVKLIDRPDGVLDKSFPVVKFQSAPEGLFYNGLQTISLAGNMLGHSSWSFPHSLRILNLANNFVKTVSFINPLPNLQFLNVSNNRISSLEIVGCNKLKEIFICYNQLKSLKDFRNLPDIEVLDASFNSLNNLASLKFLISLKVIGLKGNPISKAKINSLIVNPVSIFDYSQFNQYVLPFVPLKRPPNYKYTSQKS